MTHLRDGLPRRRRAAAATAAAVAVSVGGLVAGATPAAAAGPVDQQQTAIDFPVAPPALASAQTFTSAVAGMLDQVDVAIERASGTTSGIFTVEIQTLVGGEPSGTVITTGSIPASSVTVSSGGDDVTMPLVAVPLTPVQISAGQEFAIVISHPTDEWFTSLAFGDHYVPGVLHVADGLGGWATITPDADMAFRTHVSGLGLPPEVDGLISGLLRAIEQILPPLKPLTTPLADLFRSLRL